MCKYYIYIRFKIFSINRYYKYWKNPKGLFGISFRKRNILIYPSTEEIYGKLTIKNYDSKKYIYLNPQENAITNFTLSYNGNYLATESSKDKTIKIFDAKNGNCLDKLSFANEKIYEIKCISINPKNNYILLSCNKGLFPIWSLSKANDLIGSILDIDDKTKNFEKGLFYKKFIAFNHVNLDQLTKADYEVVQPGDHNMLFIITSNCEFFRIIFNSRQIKNSTGKFDMEEKRQIFN